MWLIPVQAMHHSPVGIVIIGCNEGDRLVHYLKRVQRSQERVVYVDAASSAGSAILFDSSARSVDGIVSLLYRTGRELQPQKSRDLPFRVAALQRALGAQDSKFLAPCENLPDSPHYYSSVLTSHR
jgi:hypothetical protein